MTDTPRKTGALGRASSAAAAAHAAAEERARRNRAARDAHVAAPPAPETLIACRVLPLGDGVVSMGFHIAGIGEAYFARGETFDVDEPIARQLETRGLVEITGAADAASAEAP